MLHTILIIAIVIHCRQQEVQVELKDDSCKEEQLGYIMIKLKIESGMTSVAQKEQKTFKMQKPTRVIVYTI